MDRLMDLEDKVRSSAVASICDAAVKNLQVGQVESRMWTDPACCMRVKTAVSEPRQTSGPGVYSSQAHHAAGGRPSESQVLAPTASKT